jgi:hypothetical protein
MKPEIEALLDRLDVLQSEMAKHRTQMRNKLRRGDPDWATELEKYYFARQALLDVDKELAVLLRRREPAA